MFYSVESVHVKKVGIPKVKSNFLPYTNKRKTLNASRNVPHGGILGPSSKFNTQ